jgi:hypothetical protein
MDKIRRKPVSLAFSASDFSPVLTSSLTLSQSVTHLGISTPQEPGLGGNESSDSHFRLGDETRDGSRTTLLDRLRSTDHRGITPAESDLTIRQANHTVNISELPTDYPCSTQVTQPANAVPQVRSFDGASTGKIWTSFWLKTGTCSSSSTYLSLYLPMKIWQFPPQSFHKNLPVLPELRTRPIISPWQSNCLL